ncbi:MAG: YifB family Mg chelatase-like AAA ATPase, partial [Sandaracinaceae bacterium]|nr:YifB family Mg chelatase-like AAA ATPase [Sandaracinaceae bacterium]
GVDAHKVDVEVHLGRGLPGFEIVGLPEGAVRESRVRVCAALAQSGFDMPPRHVILNLAPADMRKRGSHFDLAIAAGILASCGLVFDTELQSTLLVGELSLTGELRPVTGLLPMLRCAQKEGLGRAIIPLDQLAEASLVRGMDVFGAADLRSAIAFLTGESSLPRACGEQALENERPDADMAEVAGQLLGKRALEVAAAGQHDVLFMGPPGAGKTMLAKRLPGILPPPTREERLEIATIASAAGLPIPTSRPFRAPHHTSSGVALVGGGDPIRPGEVTLAHGGVLFLDELPEFNRTALESLRTVMEAGEVHIVRAHERALMPARCIIVGAMNPCPCGYAGDPNHRCHCAPGRAEAYRARISGPLLDRFDLRVWLSSVSLEELDRAPAGEPSASIRARVIRARDRAQARGDLEEGRRPSNTARLLAKHLTELRPSARQLLENASNRLGLSMRSVGRVLRVARTIAHLAESDHIEVPHLAEALRFRGDFLRDAKTDTDTLPKQAPSHQSQNI